MNPIIRAAILLAVSGLVFAFVLHGLSSSRRSLAGFYLWIIGVITFLSIAGNAVNGLVEAAIKKEISDPPDILIAYYAFLSLTIAITIIVPFWSGYKLGAWIYRKFSG